MIFALALLASGCTGLDSAVPVGENRATGAKALPARFATSKSFIVESRYLVLPVGLEGSKVLMIPSSFSVVGAADLDLEVVDLQTGEHHRVFGKPASLQAWQLSFRNDEHGALRFTNLLILEARTKDANADGQLTWEDPVLLYGYDLAKHELFPILPENTSFLDCNAMDDRLILTLETGGGKVSVYTYSPSTREGHFVVEGLSP